MLRKIAKYTPTLVAIAVCICARFERPLLANSVTLTPIFDVTTDSLNIFDGPYLRMGNLAGAPLDFVNDFESRAIVKFDVSSIPTGSTINVVTLKLTQQDLNLSNLVNWPGRYGYAQILGIDQAYDPGNAQQLYDATSIFNATVVVNVFSNTPPGGGTAYVNAPGTYTLSSTDTGANCCAGLKPRVEGWVNGTIVNRGFAVRQGAEGFTLTGRQFVSSNVITPLKSDANFDGVVNSLDVQAWQADYRFQNGNVFPKPTDFDFDWDVDGNDFLMLQREMGSLAGTGPGPLAPMLIIDFTPPGIGSGATVPEPSSVILGSAGALVTLLLSGRKRRVRRW